MPNRKTKEKPKPKPKYNEYISEKEFKSRRKVWNDYYFKVKETKAYKRYQEQTEALKKGDMVTVKRLAKESRQQQADEKWELTKPPYPDPTIERRYKRLGVREWDMDSAEVAREIFGT